MNSNFTRRGFIKTGAAGVGLTILSNTGVVFGENTKRPFRQRPILINSHGSNARDSLGERGNRSAWSILDGGGTALDAVEKCTNTIESDPDDSSVGYGGTPNEEGVVQLDSTIFDGKAYNYGAVGCLENIMHPSSVARLVMERTDHIMLVDKGALAFAKMHGFKEENLLTEKSRKRWLAWKENLSDTDDYLPPKETGGDNNDADEEQREYESELWKGRITGTVNVIAVDKTGNISGITSTSGLAWKIPGRLGDSPIIGAGLYGDNAIGGAGATGRGEEVIKTCGSFLLVEFMRNGMSPQQACEAVCQRIIDNYNGRVNFNDKFVALNKEGELGCAQIRGNRTPKMACMSDEGHFIFEGKTMIEVE
ncbi:MAG: N(4)-(beta-N-acetylglucosaminyl)-L-asparaginase, partial [bacterium]|nr:N(4)-(beta-N-acetylglucosaminyl)-L-asparaginase [bacterium]